VNELRASVESIMSCPLYSVLEDDSVEEAYNRMKEYGTKKILVIDKNGDPKGVLEGWKISPRDFNKKVKDIPLGPFRLLPQGTDIDEVENALANASAVYVTDRNNKKIIGVVTSYDLYKAL
jgi:predicted transcriptional regulator